MWFDMISWDLVRHSMLLDNGFFSALSCDAPRLFRGSSPRLPFRHVALSPSRLATIDTKPRSVFGYQSQDFCERHHMLMAPESVLCNSLQSGWSKIRSMFIPSMHMRATLEAYPFLISPTMDTTLNESCSVQSSFCSCQLRQVSLTQPQQHHRSPPAAASSPAWPHAAAVSSGRVHCGGLRNPEWNRVSNGIILGKTVY